MNIIILFILVKLFHLYSILKLKRSNELYDLGHRVSRYDCRDFVFVERHFVPTKLDALVHRVHYSHLVKSRLHAYDRVASGECTNRLDDRHEPLVHRRGVRSTNPGRCRANAHD